MLISEAQDSSARKTVVPTAITRPPFCLVSIIVPFHWIRYYNGFIKILRGNKNITIPFIVPLS